MNTKRWRASETLCKLRHFQNRTIQDKITKINSPLVSNISAHNRTFFSKRWFANAKPTLQNAHAVACTAWRAEKNTNCTESLMLVYLCLPYLQLANKLNDQPNQLLRCTAARQQSNPVIEEYKLNFFWKYSREEVKPYEYTRYCSQTTGFTTK